MKPAKRNEAAIATEVSYWYMFRLVFVVFSFYLVGDALYRWNGFRYYATLSEFLPGVALVSIFWSIIAVFTAYLLWLPLKVISLLSSHRKWSWLDRLQLFIYLLFFWVAAILSIKRILWLNMPVSSEVKLIAFTGMTVAAAFFSVAIEWLSIRIKWKNPDYIMHFVYIFVLLGVTVWMGKQMMPFDPQVSFHWILLAVILLAILINLLFHNKAKQWIEVIQRQITIWVWLFGLIVIFSVPLVAYHAWLKNPGETVSHGINPSYVSGKDRPNVVLITFDALSARNMSVYGYERPTTPFIDKWAEMASVFTRVKAAGNWTSSTTSSLMTGKRVWSHSVFQSNAYRINKVNSENLPLLLKENGYYNMAYISTRFASPKKNGLARNFDINPSTIIFRKWLQFIGRIDLKLYKVFGEKIRLYNWIIKRDFIFGKFLKVVNKTFLRGKDETTYYESGKVFNKFLEEIDSNPPEPFFAWIHIYPPHAPYMPPEPFKGIFESSLKTKGKNLTKEEIKHHEVLTQKARYDELIMSCDKQFEEFMKNLSLRDKLNNTVIILSADHGELFEDFRVGHGGYDLYESALSIPLIIKEPDREGGQIIDELTEQIDIPVTIMELAHIPVPAWMEGRSLLPLMRNKKIDPKPVFSMNFERNSSKALITKGVIAVWEGDFKLIYNLEEKKSVLFNLRHDPSELNNIIQREPNVGRHLRSLILDNLRKANEKIREENKTP